MMFEFHWATLVLMGIVCFFAGGICGTAMTGSNNPDPY